jgi:predicted transglutaminase-like cysteine proteinase
MVGGLLHRTAPLALAGGLLFAQPAQAALGIMAMPMAATSALKAVDGCSAANAPALGAPRSGAALPMQSKAAALLGGQVSQLELMRQQQAGAAPAAAPAMAGFASTTLPEPGAGVMTAPVSGTSACSDGFGLSVRSVLPAPRYGAAPLLPVVPSADTILASKRLQIRSTPFDRDWNRVRGSGLSRSVAASAFGQERGTLGLTTLSAVNSWANAEIRYVEDRELYGQADRWATAGETLRRRAGDCEDIAIVKMQLLAAHGVRREDMQLVIARDLVRGADHAVLVVRLGDQSWLLDNATDQVLDASLSYDYRPIMSFSQGKKWIHGY